MKLRTSVFTGCIASLAWLGFNAKHNSLRGILMKRSTLELICCDLSYLEQRAIP